MKFAFIHAALEIPQARQGQWTASALCRILGVSRSGYGAWQRRQNQPLSPRQRKKQQAQARLCVQIRAAHRRGRHYYGSPRVYDELRDQGIRVSRKRIASLMRDARRRVGWA
jgi:putative transposase